MISGGTGTKYLKSDFWVCTYIWNQLKNGFPKTGYGPFKMSDS